VPLYFFHLRDAAFIKDETGTELPDDASARTEAVRLVGEIVRDKAEAFWNDGRWSVEVQDAGGGVVATLDVLGHTPIR
jgi:hypothetical protein